jgi:heme A synthase
VGKAHPSLDATGPPSVFRDSGARYGLVVVVPFLSLTLVAPEPWGWTTVWVVLFLQALLGSWIVWRRLRLRYFASAGIALIMFNAAMALYSWRGYTPNMIVAREPWPILALMLVAILLVPLSIAAETLVDSPAWQAWRRRMDEQPSIWEMLTFRHVPHVRRDG